MPRATTTTSAQLIAIARARTLLTRAGEDCRTITRDNGAPGMHRTEFWRAIRDAKRAIALLTRYTHERPPSRDPIAGAATIAVRHAMLALDDLERTSPLVTWIDNEHAREFQRTDVKHARQMFTRAAEALQAASR